MRNKDAYMMNRKICIAVIILAGTIQATVWYVHPDSTLHSIQAALDSCSVHDTVLVGPGTYYENLIWPSTQGIDLLSEFGPDSAIIDGASAGSAVLMASEMDTSTAISFFTIRNGCAEIGGGILCSNHSAPKIFGNLITGNSATATVYSGGAGMACIDSSAPYIVGNTIQDNSAYSSGGGIACDYYSSPQILGNTVINNTAWYGAGIFCCDNSSPAITGNTVCYNHYPSTARITLLADYPCIATNSIDFNRTPFQGGGICLWLGCTSFVDANSIYGNSAMCAGGGIACLMSSPVISNNTISENSTDDYGGGIACIECDSLETISGNTVIANEAQWGGGIAVLGFSLPPVISNNTVAANNCDGIYCDQSVVVIYYNNITNNSGCGVRNVYSSTIVNAEYNWWADSTGPYHPTLNPGGMGDTVSDYVDFEPWLYHPWTVLEDPIIRHVDVDRHLTATIFRGHLHLPAGKNCKVFDISGRCVEPNTITSGIYFIEVEGKVVQKVIKIQ
jgi:parallel beta-helix repeat protein